MRINRQPADKGGKIETFGDIPLLLIIIPAGAEALDLIIFAEVNVQEDLGHADVASWSKINFDSSGCGRYRDGHGSDMIVSA